MQLLIPSILELTLLQFFLLSLHFLRKSLGLIPLYMVMAFYMLVNLVMCVPNFMVDFFLQKKLTPFSQGTLVLPLVMMILLIYETMGTQEAQKIIVGLIITMIAAITLMIVLGKLHSRFILELIDSFRETHHPASSFNKYILTFAFSQIIVITCIPVIFQALRNWKIPFQVCLSLSLAIIYACIGTNSQTPANGANPEIVLNDLLVRVILILESVGLVCLYLRILNIPLSNRPNTKSFFDAFVYHIQTAERMRQSLAEWEERYQLVIDNSPALIFIEDKEQNVINANTAAINMLGNYLSGDRQGHPFLFDENMTPIQHQQIWESLINDPAPQATKYLSRVKLKKDDDDYLDVDLSASRATIANQPVAIVIIRDMSELRAQEKKQQELQEQLFHSQRLESIGVLAGGIAHDFNNLLHSIQGSADDLAAQPNLTSRQVSMLGNINTATKRAAMLTSQLLGFARKGKFHVESLNLQALVEQTAQLFQATAKNIRFKLLVEPNLPLVSGDASQLQQVILNLLINARDALESNTENPKITLRAQAMREQTPEWQQRPQEALQPQDFVCIKIKDNGCGIDEETQKKIFEPFFTTKEVGKGTGMGLAMAYGCIAHHHGWITVDSKPGVGTEFTLSLPIEQNQTDTENT